MIVTSAGAPKRPMGLRARKFASRASASSPAAAKVARSIGVSIGPGQTQLARMPCATWLSAMLFVISTTAPLLAE